MPQSALIHFDIDRAKLRGLRLEAPAAFTRLRQRSVPRGTAYDAEAEKLSPAMRVLSRRGDLVDDNQVMGDLRERLSRLARSGKAVPAATLDQQLHRESTRLDLPPEPKDEMTPTEIYRHRRDAVVIVGSLNGSGQMTMATGVVLTATGVIVTNAHVMEKAHNPGVVFGVLTRGGAFYPVVEVLAASRAADLALLRIEAHDLPVAPLAEDAEVGEPVTVLSHPGDRFYSLTQGIVSRFFRFTNVGHPTVRMTITADFAIGSSGARCSTTGERFADSWPPPTRSAIRWCSRTVPRCTRSGR